MLAVGIRCITDLMGHNSPETSEIAPAFYQMVNQVSRNVFFLTKGMTFKGKSPVCWPSGRGAFCSPASGLVF